MTLLRQEETMYILNNYQAFTHQKLLDHFVKNNNDSDCVYIFDNLPKELQKELDDIAGEISKQNQFLIGKNDAILQKLDELIEASSKRNKKLDDEIYQIENELERVRELNRQLGIY